MQSVSRGPGARPVAPTPAQFGQTLKRLLRGPAGQRVKVGSLARRAGLSQSTLYAYLAGTTLPSAETLDELLQALEVPPAAQGEIATLRDVIDDHRRRRPPARATPPVPRELPADPADLVGRARECDRLDAALDTARSGRVGIVAITGPAGSGKTALAVYWAHRRRHDFPDGTLYLDLHGYSPGEPREPGDVLGELLRSVGVLERDIPRHPADRARRLRSALADRRILLLLDNALDADQVRPLLPGQAGPFVVITSREALSGLTVTPGAQHVLVPPLSRDTAVDLLSRQLSERGALDRELVAELAARCVGLPLAVRILGAQARRMRGPLSVLIHELGDGLSGFDLDDSDLASMREVLSWSERCLPPTTVRALMLLGDAPITRFTIANASAVLGRDLPTTRIELRRLIRYHLLESLGDNSYRLGELVRLYARERAATLGADQRIDAWRRLARALREAEGPSEPESEFQNFRLMAVPASGVGQM